MQYPSVLKWDQAKNYLFCSIAIWQFWRILFIILLHTVCTWRRWWHFVIISTLEVDREDSILFRDICHCTWDLSCSIYTHCTYTQTSIINYIPNCNNSCHHHLRRRHHHHYNNRELTHVLYIDEDGLSRGR